MHGTVHPSISKTPIPRDAQGQHTACVLCSHNCGLQVDVEAGRIAAVRPDADNPITHGYACNKAFSIGRYVDHPQRVTHPLERRPDGSFERVSWDRAISEISRRLSAIVERHSPRSFALVGVGGQANHMEAPYALGFLQGVGSRRWFNAYAQEKTQNHLVEYWMMEASPGVFLHADLDRCRYLLVLGTNPKVSNRGHAANETFRTLQRDASRRLVVVDPRATETARGADLHIAVRPGQDVYLLLGLAAALVQRELCDRAFLDAHTRDAQPLLQVLAELDVDAMARRCGVDREVVVAEAEAFAGADGAAILWDLGIEQGRFSTLNAYLIRVLLALTGNLGREGGNAFIESFNPPGPGRARGEPERALVSGIAAIRALGNYGMFSPSLFPEEVLNDHPERIRAAIVTGSNPLLSFSDTARWREAFAALELSVVIEPAMTETARLADFVLPTPVGYEKWEMCSFPNGYPAIKSQLRRPVVAGPEDALPEPEIFVRLAEAMDLFGRPPRALRSMASLAGAPTGRAALSAALLGWARQAGRRRGNGTQNRVLFWAYRLLGPHLPAPSLVAPWFLCLQNAIVRREAALRTMGASFRYRTPFALASAMFDRLLEHPEGAQIGELSTEDHLARNIGYADKRIRLSPAPMMAEMARALARGERADADYPLVLSAGVRTRWTANTIHRDPDWRKGKGPHCPLRLAPADASALGLAAGDRARLITERGAAELPVVVDGRLPEGFVVVPNGFGGRSEDGSVDGTNLNELTAADDRDPYTGCPHHKHVRCRVESVAS